MRINIICNYVHGGWKPTDIRLGGTEKSITHWAKELEKLGHKVAVYDNETRSSYDGGGDLCVNVKSSDIPPKEPTVYFTNETNASDLDLSAYDCVIWPSQWAKDNIPVNNPNVKVVPHGYDPTQVYPGKKILKQCIYTSSPDRGLNTLLKAWPEVYAKHPDASLIITYGADGVDLPGVVCLGDVDEDMMAELYKSSDIWCHPANGGELFCISGLEAQAAGCVPVYNPVMALNETVRQGFKNEKDYAKTLTYVLDHPEKVMWVRSLLAEEVYPTWQDSTKMLLDVLNSVYKEKTNVEKNRKL